MSVLALLALACFPVLAQAGLELDGVQYTRRLPSAEGDNPPANDKIAGDARRPPDDGGSPTGRQADADSSELENLRRKAHLRKAEARRRATTAAPGRVAQATAPTRRTRLRAAAQPGRRARPPRSQRRRWFLAPGPDPDRDCRPGGDLGRRGDGQAAAPAGRSTTPLPLSPRPADVPSTRKRPLGLARTLRWPRWRSRRRRSRPRRALAAALAVPANFWGVVAPGRADRRTVPAPEAPAGSTACASRSTGARSSRYQGRAANFVQRGRPGRRARARPGIEVLPFLYGAPAWAVPPVGVPGRQREAPKTLPVRTGAQRSRLDQLPRSWSSPATDRTAASGPRTRRCRSGRSAPGRSGTSRTSSTSSPGPTRPSTASWSSSPTRRSRASTRGQDRPRRPVRAAPGRRNSKSSRRRPTSPPTSSTSSTGRRPGSSRSSTASPCTPTPAPTRS